MEQKNIENIVAEFLSSQTIKFSAYWKAELIRKCRAASRAIAQSTHNSMLSKMFEEENEKFDIKFSSLSDTNRDEIKGNAVEKWNKSFDATKSIAIEPERFFYQKLLKQAESDWYEKSTMSKKDKDGNLIVDEKGKEIREKKISTVTIHENTDDNVDENEESQFDDNKESKEGISKIESDYTGSVDEPNTEYTFLNYLKEKFRWYHEYFYDSVLSDETESLPDEVFEIKNFLLLSGQIKILNRNEPIKRTYKPTKDSTLYPCKPEFENLSDESVNALHRLQYLKNAEKHGKKAT